MNILRTWSARLLPAAFVALALLAQPALADRKDSDKYLAEGRKSLEKGDSRAAIINLKNAVRADDTNLEARRMLGLAQLAVGDWLSAEKELGIFVEGAPDDSAGIVPYGDALLQLNRHADVLAKVVPKNRAKEVEAQVLAIRGFALAGTGKAIEAERTFRESLALAPSVRAHLGLARGLFRSQGVPAAEAEVAKALELQPGNYEALLARADLLRFTGKNDAALADLQQAIAATPNNSAARLTRAGLLIQLGRDNDAAADIDAVLNRTRGHPLGTYYKALLQARGKDIEGAVQTLQGLSVEFLDSYPPALYLTGALAYARNQLEQAEGRLRVYLGKVPDNVAARKILGSVYLRKNENERALTTLQPALAAAPTDLQLLQLMGTAAERLGRTDEALGYFERATEQAPEDSGLQTRIALNKLRGGQNDEAVASLESIIEKDPTATRATVALLATYIRNNEFDKAMSEVAELKKRLPDSPLPLYYEGTVHSAKRDFPAARQAFEAALQRDGKFKASRFALSRLDLAEDKPAAALAQIDKLLEIDPKDQRAIIFKSEIQARQGSIDDAIATLDRARRSDPAATDIRYRLVDALLSKRDGERALIVARELINLTGSAPPALDALGRSQLAVGEKTSAIGTYRQIVSQLPESGAALQRLAGAMLANEDEAGAMQTLLESARVDPNYAPAQQDYVRLAARGNNAQGAVAAAKKLVDTAPKSTVAPLLLGEAYMMAKQYPEAITTLRAARRANPTVAVLLREAAALEAAGRAAEGTALLEEWVKDKPGDTAGRLALASHLMTHAKPDAAIQQYEQVLAQSPGNVVAMNNLAWLLRDKNSDKALDYARRAAELAPNASEVLDTYGWLLVLRGEPEKALVPLRRAASVSNPLPEVRYHLAQALSATGKREEAAKILSEILADAKPFDGRKDAEALRRKLAEK